MTRNRKFIVAGVALVAMGLAAAGAFAERGGPWGITAGSITAD